MAEGRFRSPKTIEEEELCVERAVPKSTRYKNKWAIGIFEDWQRVRSVNVPILESRHENGSYFGDHLAVDAVDEPGSDVSVRL
ncbi:hypothetical protein ACROYT_G012802 [Oculina patagonica]